MKSCRSSCKESDKKANGGTIFPKTVTDEPPANCCVWWFKSSVCWEALLRFRGMNWYFITVHFLKLLLLLLLFTPLFLFLLFFFYRWPRVSFFCCVTCLLLWCWVKSSHKKVAPNKSQVTSNNAGLCYTFIKEIEKVLISGSKMLKAPLNHTSNWLSFRSITLYWWVHGYQSLSGTRNVFFFSSTTCSSERDFRVFRSKRCELLASWLCFSVCKSWKLCQHTASEEGVHCTWFCKAKSFLQNGHILAFETGFQLIHFIFISSADSHQSPGHKTALYGGDIKFTPKQQENMKKYGNPYSPQSRAASNVDSERWPNAVIPYKFDCSVGK